MVQRHLRFDGEKDTRTPHDFSNSKPEEAADDDDDVDDDDPAHRPPKARGNAPPGKSHPKVKSESSANGSIPIRPVPPSSNTDLSMTIDLDYRSSRVSPTGHPSTSMPISGERHGAGTPASGVRGISLAAKRQRLSDDAGMHALPHAASQSLNIAHAPAYPYRLEVDMSQYPVQGHITPLSSIPPSHSASHPSLHTPIYGTGGVGMMSSQGPSQGFLPQVPQAPFDMGNHQPPPTLRTVSFPSHSPSPYTPHQQPQTLQSVYSHHSRPSSQAQPHSTASGMAVELLGGGSEHASGHGSASFQPFDWPVHQQSAQHENGHAAQQNSNDANWFDFLTGGSVQAGAGAGGASSLFPTHTRPASSSMSSTRSVGSFGLPPPSHSSSEGLSPTLGQKRTREEDAVVAAMSGSEFTGEDLEREDDRMGRGGNGNGAGPPVRRSVSVDKPPN